MDSAALQHRAFKRRTSFCFCRRASRFVQKAQEQSRRIKRRLGSSSSIGRDMAGVVELPVHHTDKTWGRRGVDYQACGGGAHKNEKIETVGCQRHVCFATLAGLRLLN